MLLSTLLISTVAAHATFNPPVSTGSYSQAGIRISHGCNKTSTIAVTVQIPQNVTSVKPARAFGWSNLNVTKRPLAVPIVAEGVSVVDEVDTVTWSGGLLSDDEYQDFGLAFKLPPAADGTKFYFPVTQQCVQGWNNWTQIPVDASKLSYPAPTVTVFSNGTLAKFNQSLVVTTKSSAVGKGNMLLPLPIVTSIMVSVFLL